MKRAASLGALVLLAPLALAACRKKPSPPIIDGVYACAADADCVMNDFACCSDCRRPIAYSKKALTDAKSLCQREDCPSFENGCPEGVEPVDRFVAVCRAGKCAAERKKP